MDYRHTHVSRYDGSPAMEIPQTDAPYSIVLVNEDGHEWIDPLGWWIPIDEVTDDDRAEWEEDEYPYKHQSQSGAEFMAAYYNSDSYINYLNG